LKDERREEKLRAQNLVFLVTRSGRGGSGREDERGSETKRDCIEKHVTPPTERDLRENKEEMSGRG